MTIVENQSDDGSVFIILGVCAMAKKTKSKPMKEILRRLEKFQYIKVIVFEEKVILRQPIEAWPLCDALISFYSDGFPLQKAIAYAELRRPYLVNDLKAQYVLMDRKKVYECLQMEGIPVPRYACVERGDPSNHVNVVEHDDAIEIDGEIFHKPFVEKPLNAEDHNIYIYFPSSAGGGSQRLFRKVGDRSSKYFQISTIRTEGSYLYEEFMPTDGTDVKVYTVADDYAHAEARKSPALDGKVERDSEGKEIRYPVILTPREKIIAKKVAKVVKQQICGFDLLRANGMSYVCDVNGFSFVKTSRKYYDDCSHVLGVLITRVIAPRLCPPGLGPWNTPGPDDDIPLVPTTCGTIMELRCVIAVFRHGDRTPKQKMKMDVRDDRFFKLFNKYSGGRTLELKLKKPTQLQEVLDIVRNILEDIESGKLKNSELEEKKAKFEQLRYVLEMYGSFSGINRKIQLKYQPNGRQTDTGKKKDGNKNGADDKSSASSTATNTTANSNTEKGSGEVSGVLEGGQSTSAATGTAGDSEPCILLVVKWGGELTAAGRQQAEQLGRAFRCIYPGGDGNYGKNPGLGLLRLHSTYRHDLKIYASDEGRVQMTAAAFAKGFLALEGELPPILVQMVKSANTNGLLDNDNDCHQYQQMVKKRIKKVMSYKGVWGEEHRQALAPTGAKSLLNAMDYVGNPTEACAKLFGYVQRLANRVAMLTANLREREKINLYHNESWDLLLRRWGKLVKDFRSHNGDYDVSKLPDIYDNIKYDIQHNPGILIESEMLDFFSLARALADIVVPQEYGITKEEKLVISQRICTPLLRKILSDARYTDVDECTRLHAGYSKGVASPERFVRTRLYFTSESHLHSILTCLEHGGLADAATDEQWKRAMDYVSTVPELNYLSQVVIMIYEDPTVEPKTEKKFHVELHFSPGAHALCRDLPAGSGFRPGRREKGCCSQTSLLSSSTSLAETSFDSASEHAGVDVTPTHSPPALSSRKIVFSAHDQFIGKATVTSCHSLSIDRSLPSDLQEVGRISEPLATTTTNTTSAVGKVSSKSHYEKHRKRQRFSRQTSAIYRPKESMSGLCYADVVNQDAVIGHRSRMQELWLDNMRKVHRRHQINFKRGSERSMSTGPMVEHVVTLPLLQSEGNSTWHEKTLTTLRKPLQRVLNSDGENASQPSSRPTSEHLSQTHGRFTVTSSLESSAIKPATSGNPQSLSWFTGSVDLDDDGVATTGESEVSTSHSTLDLAVATPLASQKSSPPLNSPPSSKVEKSRHSSATTPGSPVKWRCRNGISSPSSVTTPISRRMSFGDQPPEFCPLQKKSSGIGVESGGGGSGGREGGEEEGEGADETSTTVTQVYTSLDSVKPDRAQELFNHGAPVAQWLMEYFDQIEKAKWSKVESQGDEEETGEVGVERWEHRSSLKPADYKPILSAADYLKADACASAIPKVPSCHANHRGSTDQVTPSKGKLDGLPSTHMEDNPMMARKPSESATEERTEVENMPVKMRNLVPKTVHVEAPSDNSRDGSTNSLHHDVNGLDTKELNALTYPNYQMQIDFKELQQCPLGKDSCGTNSPCCSRRHRRLISTAVIRGSRDTYSSSVPDLVQLLNCSDSDGQSQTETPQNPADFMVPSAPSVPEIYPLETLHNAMTLHQLESFFTRLTTTKFPSPFTSPCLSSTGGGGGGLSSVSSTEQVGKTNLEAARGRYALTAASADIEARRDVASSSSSTSNTSTSCGAHTGNRRSVSEPGEFTNCRSDGYSD
ncbi:inositol hexakisphosphate [Echinococcus multilocularis]|uniref:Inositol hexakisphosphate and diphosphoinositol-pentakisphosphate kinase n=1 Tax=Echinococcus multilocularis TaxID=6211 RepID=A0A087VXH2_ECHMU|nr:inositol hexakisphosphate [Echinococcus multilocularis]